MFNQDWRSISCQDDDENAYRSSLPNTDYLNIHTRQRKLPPRLCFSWHMPEELPAVFVPLDGVEYVGRPKLPPAREMRTRAQWHVCWHAQLQQLQAGSSVVCQQGKNQLKVSSSLLNRGSEPGSNHPRRE